MDLKYRSIGSTIGRVVAMSAGAFVAAGLFCSPVTSAETDTSKPGVISPLASSTCFVGSSGNCTTAAVTANSSAHFVDIGINNRLRPSPCPWRVRDVNNGVVVRSGTVGTASSHGERIWGLYSVYQLELRGCSVSARGDIDNT
jgi:hypothetical protein